MHLKLNLLEQFKPIKSQRENWFVYTRSISTIFKLHSKQLEKVHRSQSEKFISWYMQIFQAYILAVCALVQSHLSSAWCNAKKFAGEIKIIGQEGHCGCEAQNWLCLVRSLQRFKGHLAVRLNLHSNDQLFEWWLIWIKGELTQSYTQHCYTKNFEGALWCRQPLPSLFYLFYWHLDGEIRASEKGAAVEHCQNHERPFAHT